MSKVINKMENVEYVHVYYVCMYVGATEIGEIALRNKKDKKGVRSRKEKWEVRNKNEVWDVGNKEEVWDVRRIRKRYEM